VYSTPVYLALLMVVSGVALVSCRDVNFSSFSLIAGMVSNAAFALYSIYAKRAMQAHPEVLTPRTAYALLTMGSLTMLTPLALVMEWSGAGASRLASASTAVGTLRTGWRLAALLGFTGLVQYVSNEIAFCTLSMIHPVTYAVANTLKRSIVVASSLVSQPTAPTGGGGGGGGGGGARGGAQRPRRAVSFPNARAPPWCAQVFFQQTLPATGYAGAFMAIAGAFMYSVYSVAP
jgi:solute carrier family 35 protein E1